MKRRRNEETGGTEQEIEDVKMEKKRDTEEKRWREGDNKGDNSGTLGLRRVTQGLRFCFN
jgi:hypothetical protein